MNLVIPLWAFPIPPMLLVGAPTGIHYLQQTGGLSCNHKEIEGFMAPAHEIKEGSATRLQSYFDAVDALGDTDAEALNEILQGFAVYAPDEHFEDGSVVRRLSTMRATTEGLLRSEEAWLHVMSPYGDAVLTWGNSD